MTTTTDAPAVLEPAGVVSRGAAGVIDVLVVSVVAAATLWGVTAVLTFFGVDAASTALDELVGVGAVALFTTVYFAGCWALFGRTPGCWLLGIRVVRADGGRVHFVRAVARLLLTNLSTSVLMLGWGWAVVDRRHRTWHDLLTKTLVVYEARA